jgi:aldose 1-epimerase
MVAATAFGSPGGTSNPVSPSRTIRAPEGMPAVEYDHNFCLSASRRPLAQAVWLQGAHSGVEMEVWTTEPGLQFFDGNFPPRGGRGLEGRAYDVRAGFCLEPQTWPDSPNRPYFPQAVLRPGETYRQITEYRFRLPHDFCSFRACPLPERAAKSGLTFR